MSKRSTTHPQSSPTTWSRVRDRAAPHSQRGAAEEEHIVGGAGRTEGAKFERFDPCQPDVLVSAAFSAPIELVGEAVAEAREAFTAWRRTSVEERCNRC